MDVTIPTALAENCRRTAEATSWLRRVPDMLRELRFRWHLTPGRTLDAHSALVVLVERPDGGDAVLKLGMPHFEAKHEIQGLSFWAGHPTVRLLKADVELDAMLLERCVPGTSLDTLPESEQDEVIADLLLRLWRAPASGDLFRPLTAMLSTWSSEVLADRARWLDAGLVREGLRLFDALTRSSPSKVLLATDLHAGNVLRAEREPWLVIDPKPFVGDPAYDATQHLLNCAGRLRSDPKGTVDRFADMLGLDAERVALWTFARAAATPWAWSDEWLALARALAP
jgi:streptomycin 6-kinase